MSPSTHAPVKAYMMSTFPFFQRKASIEAKNEAETQIYSAESSLREYKDKLPQNIQDSINTEISNVRSSLESEDAEEIRSKVCWALRHRCQCCCIFTSWVPLVMQAGIEGGVCVCVCET